MAPRKAAAGIVGRGGGHRAGDGPTLIEARTYRLCGHSKSDQCEYRSAEQEAEWAARDPLPQMRQQLISLGVLDEQAADDVEKEAAAEIERAVSFAESSPEPDPATVDRGVLAGSYPQDP